MATDRIILEGLEFYGRHGVHAAERALGQRFVVDAELVLDLRPAGASDDLARTVDYGAAYATIRGVVEGAPRQLVEAVAEGIAAALLGAYPIDAVRVRVSKPAAPIPDAVFARVGVEITRSRVAPPNPSG